MTSILPYGIDSSLSLDLPDEVLLAECGIPRTPSLDDPAAATERVLCEPVGFPPLRQCITPEDQVVLTLDENVPQSGKIVAAVIRNLVDEGLRADGITVLRTEIDAQTGNGDPRPWLSAELAEAVELAVHDPTDRESLAFLAQSDKDAPVHLNRLITDADMVIPIGCLRHRAAGYYGVHGAVFPTFSDRKTLGRFRAPASLDSQGHPKKKVSKLTDRVGWLLGISMAIQVIPGRGDQILHVLAGEVHAIERKGRQLYREAWGGSVPHRASLVIASIEGNPAEQTWHNVGRALANAAELVEEGGAIAVCCDLAGQPGPGIQHLRSSRSRNAAFRWIEKRRPLDALPATQLEQAQARAKVYLLSRLDETLIEDLEMIPLAEPNEVVRLASHHQSCILLSNAPHAMVTEEEA